MCNFTRNITSTACNYTHFRVFACNVRVVHMFYMFHLTSTVDSFNCMLSSAIHCRTVTKISVIKPLFPCFFSSASFCRWEKDQRQREAVKRERAWERSWSLNPPEIQTVRERTFHTLLDRLEVWLACSDPELYFQVLLACFHHQAVHLD